jgi:hypothetical protein
MASSEPIAARMQKRRIGQKPRGEGKSGNYKVSFMSLPALAAATQARQVTFTGPWR